MDRICKNFVTLRKRIAQAEQQFSRTAGSVALLAASKTQPIAMLHEAIACGQQAFGENYAQELADKANALRSQNLQWHFIGPIQSNKTRLIAEHAHWVHSVEREKIARRLHEHRAHEAVPLQVCLQVNISGEASKSGVSLQELPALAEAVAQLSHLRLRGLMTVPAASTDRATQRHAFAALREAFDSLNAQGYQLDTLSMGMSADLEAAISEGATLVRVGSALFGPRT